MAEEIDRFIAEQKSKLARERQQLQHPSNDQDVSNETANGYHKENIPPAHNADHAGHGTGAKALPSGSYENLRGNLNRQRQEEYKQFMQEKNQRSGERTKPSDGDGATLLIPDRASAQNRARLERNKEYNEFLKQQAHGKGRRATGKLEGDIPDNKITKASTNPVISNNPAAPARNGARSPTNRREFATQTPAPPTNHDDYPPAGPRKGWGTPQPVDYDDLLRRKRQEESRYRRHDDDYDYYPSRREGLRTSYSDPHLNRYPPEDGRYSRRPDPYEQEYDRRRVRFSNDDVSPRKDSYDRSYSRPPPPDRRDYPDEPGYDWGISQGGRSRTLPELERTKPAIKQDPETGAAGRQPRAKSATLVDDGFTIGNRESISAGKRKKDQYRLELEQQMKEAQEAKKRERQQDIKTAATGAVDSERIPRGASRTPGPSQTPAPSRHQQQQPQTNGYTPSFLNSTYNYNAYPPGPIGVQQGVPSRRVGNSSQPQVPELGLAEAIAKTELGGLGLEAAIAKSQTTMVERPFSIAPSASTRINQPNPGDPYAYYGLRHPLEPDPQTGRTAKTWIKSMSNSLNKAGGSLTGRDADTFAVAARPGKDLDAFMTDWELSQESKRAREEENKNQVGRSGRQQQQQGRRFQGGATNVQTTRQQQNNTVEARTPRRGQGGQGQSNYISTPFATHDDAGAENTTPRRRVIKGQPPADNLAQSSVTRQGSFDKPKSAIRNSGGYDQGNKPKGRVSFAIPDDDTRQQARHSKDFTESYQTKAQVHRAKFETVDGMRSAYEIFKDFLAQKGGEDGSNGPNANASPLLAANASLGVPPAGGGVNSYQTGNHVQQQQQQQSQQQQRQIPSYSQQPTGGFSSDPRSPRAAKDTKSYQAQLLAQMQEQQDKKKKAKQEQERYEAKLEAEIANYNPWGKGGAGAPMRDQTGNIVADLKTLHNRNEHIQESPRDPKLQLFSDLQVPPTNPAAATPGAAANNVTSPRIEATTGFSTGAEPSKFARGRGQLEPEKRQQGNPQDYKEMLRLQVEEKKRRDAEEKEKQRLEEEKEEKRLAAQRERMQKEFEVEQERQRKKKEEKEKQQQELERQLKEKQEAQEQKRKEQEEARLKREQAEDDKKRQELDQRRAAGQQGAANYNRSTVASPPIPALQPQNAKYNRSAVASPPIPTHQPQNAERTDSPPIPALRGNSDQRSDSPPIPTHNKKGSQPQEFPSQRPKSRAIKPSSDDIYNRPSSQEQPGTKLQSHDDFAETGAAPRVIEDAVDLYTDKAQSSQNKARIFPSKDIPEKYAKLDALDKFRMPPATPTEAKIRKVVPKSNAKLDPMDKLRTHHLKDGQGNLVREVSNATSGGIDDFDLVTWLRELDPALVQYAPALEENGYASLRTMSRLNKHTLLEICPDIKHAHAELILHETSRIETPRSKKKAEEETLEKQKAFLAGIHAGDGISDQGSFIGDGELLVSDVEHPYYPPVDWPTQYKPRKPPWDLQEFHLALWLQELKPDMVLERYAPALEKHGYNTQAALKALTWHKLMEMIPNIERPHTQVILRGAKNVETPKTKQIDKELVQQKNAWKRLHAQKEEQRKKGIRTIEKDHYSASPESRYSCSPPGNSYVDFLIGVSEETDMYKKYQEDQEQKLKAEEERRAKSPAIPQAAGSKDPRDVVRALSAMRQQLAVEQRRIQNQLEKHYDPHNQPSDGGGGAKKGTRSPQVDVFELARNKQKVAVHREPLNRPAAQEFSDLKNRGSQSRQRLREQYPGDPNSDITLEAQQRALLRNQQQRLEDMRKAEVSKKDKYSSMPGMSPSDFRLYDTPPVPLNSDSAFIGINTGETKMPEELRVPKPLASSRDVPSTSRPKQQQQPDPLGSLASFDSGTLDFLAQKNKERNRALRALEPDLDSLAEADDILERFMIRESHDRPYSGKSEDLSLWMRPSDDDE
ncbi:uncharacterized protein [Amphiura filiformis]|uniref:uncharacterized protein n=1 Tax=Amphiura filiformis TaxID=82378 RepID=UPI003B20F1C4